MNFTAFMTGLFALAKALPILDKWLDKIVLGWTDKKIQESDRVRSDFKNEISAIDKALERAETDEEIINLSITRSRLVRSELPNSKNTSRVL